MNISFTFTEEAVELYGDGLHVHDGIIDFYPMKASADAAAFDLKALKKSYLYAGDIAMIQTGIRVAIPTGFFGMIVPRSGMVKNQGITVANSPGIIDADYRGEVCVLLHRYRLQEVADEPGDIHWIDAGERIAQMLVMKTNSDYLNYYTPKDFAEKFDNTDRGHGGFGSTGR